MIAAPDESRSALALAALPGLGPVSIRRRLQDAGNCALAFQLAAREFAPAACDAAMRRADAILARCSERGIVVVAPTDTDYPATLRSLEDPPAVCFASGKLSLARRPAVALVGARQATPYGRRIAREFARRLARCGVVVVSGLAAGVDAEAHGATLEANGETIAILGTGVDVVYPRANDALHRRIARDGLLLSELPPGRTAHPGAFPRRNRIIAALADVVVVVEAGARSGALITAQAGAAIGRIVAAVPGPIDAEQSAGSNQLLRDGAQVLASFDDLIGLLGLTSRGREISPAPESPSASRAEVRVEEGDRSFPPGSSAMTDLSPSSPEGRVLSVLTHGARTPDELVRACGIAPREVGAALATLAVHGSIVIDPSGFARCVDARAWSGR